MNFLKIDSLGAVKNNEIWFVFDTKVIKNVCLATFWRFVFDEILHSIDFLDLFDSSEFLYMWLFFNFLRFLIMLDDYRINDMI